MAPFVIRKDVQEKAKAEAELAAAIASGDEDRIKTAEEMVRNATLPEHQARQLIQHALVRIVLGREHTA